MEIWHQTLLADLNSPGYLQHLKQAFTFNNSTDQFPAFHIFLLSKKIIQGKLHLILVL